MRLIVEQAIYEITRARDRSQLYYIRHRFFLNFLAKFSQSVAFRHSAIAPVFQTRQRRRLHARYAAEITICNPYFKLANLLVLTKCSLVRQVQQHESGTDLVFKPHVFRSFGKVQLQQTKVKKMPKLSARANKMLIGVPSFAARDRDRPRLYVPSFTYTAQQVNNGCFFIGVTR